jgi:LPS-assembly protein
MTLCTRFLITAVFLCHQVLAAALVTSQLLSNSAQTNAFSQESNEQAPTDNSSACPSQAAQSDRDSTTICAQQQEKIGDVYKLRGNVEIHYRTYILRADEITYDSDSGEATATGHFTVDGGPATTTSRQATALITLRLKPASSTM